METDPISEMPCSLEYLTMDKSKNPVIPGMDRNPLLIMAELSCSELPSQMHTSVAHDLYPVTTEVLEEWRQKCFNAILYS
jgi:hypothetical protein